MEAQLQSRVTQVTEINRQITELNDKINFCTVIFTRVKRFRNTTVILNFNLEVTQ